MSLVARYLEAHGIPTVVIATARDIVEYCGVPRLVFVDFPLGNPCGVPFDEEMQSSIMELDMGLLESADDADTTVTAPYHWPEGEKWKELIFTEAQPFLEGHAYDNWMAAKERYRRLKQQSDT